MVGSHHTKDLDLELRIEPTTYARTVAEACKTNIGKDSRRRHSDAQIRSILSNHKQDIQFIRSNKSSSKENEEEAGGR